MMASCMMWFWAALGLLTVRLPLNRDVEVVVCEQSEIVADDFDDYDRDQDDN